MTLENNQSGETIYLVQVTEGHHEPNPPFAFRTEEEREAFVRERGYLAIYHKDDLITYEPNGDVCVNGHTLYLEDYETTLI